MSAENAAGINPWFKDRAEYEEHRAMMADPALWPGNRLCIKHPDRMKQGMGAASFARCWPDGRCITLDGSEAWSFTSPEELLAAGWVVD